MSTTTTLIILGIAVAGLALGIVACVVLIVHIFATKRTDIEQRQWQQGVEHQLGRIDGKIEATKAMRIEK